MPYVREQTDLPILVRLDTGRFLNEADLRDGGQGAIVFVWDAVSGAPAPAPGCTGNGEQPKLDMGDIEPPIVGCHLQRLERVDVELSVNPLGELFADPWNRLEQLDRRQRALEPLEHAEPPRVCDLVDRSGETRSDLWQRIESFASFG